MKYLIQAYACSPYKGGEYAVSWGWIIHLDRQLQMQDEIYVVSLTLQQEDIIKYGLKHVKLVPIKGLSKYNFLNYNHLFYKIWQNKAYKTIKNMKIKIDVIHVYSLSDYRFIGKWCNIKSAYKILGPVGGGQVVPPALKEYDDSKGVIREKINALYNNSYYKHKIEKYDEIYVCNHETKRVLYDGDVLPDVPLNDKFLNLKINHRNNDEKVVILYVGRLINKKGIFFLLDVLTLIDKSVDYELLMYGDGEQRDDIVKKIIEKNLQERVIVKGAVPYDNITTIYRNADIFVMPSLRESGGSVLVEAMAHKLPIVALNMSFARILNKYNCGLFVDTNQSKREIQKDMANKLKELILKPKLRRRYGENGYKYVNEKLTWEYMIERLYGKFLDDETV